ncbi:MAG: diacylglycerol kinase [Candidatus Muirbacterium halophilum]|nr:diacylglycerol kinase [Candidatus Muirbacterium halophilum]MCK9475204.1 diacylglycerol kinase [Candidatus Muirbacterium halophilum]
MRNQPKYKFFKNWGYAMSGFLEVFKNETALRLEIIVFIILTIVSLFFKIPSIHRLLMYSCFFIVIIVELINSSIERCVDLITKDYHDLAKHAKDAVSAAVMTANFLTTFVWIFFIYTDIFLKLNI